MRSRARPWLRPFASSALTFGVCALSPLPSNLSCMDLRLPPPPRRLPSRVKGRAARACALSQAPRASLGPLALLAKPCVLIQWPRAKNCATARTCAAPVCVRSDAPTPAERDAGCAPAPRPRAACRGPRGAAEARRPNCGARRRVRRDTAPPDLRQSDLSTGWARRRGGAARQPADEARESLSKPLPAPANPHAPARIPALWRHARGRMLPPYIIRATCGVPPTIPRPNKTRPSPCRSYFEYTYTRDALRASTACASFSAHPPPPLNAFCDSR
ncbi:MAG: hypothetical protein J3K34DRAFT_428387 [Monoraphidium minutum]|nr:MAG: hypothetical protein J3K34DRAFT_428387 [Monoraphidium minutum]